MWLFYHEYLTKITIFSEEALFVQTKKFKSFDSNFSFLSLLMLVFGKNDSVKVATDKVTENRTCIYSQKLQ